MGSFQSHFGESNNAQKFTVTYIRIHTFTSTANKHVAWDILFHRVWQVSGKKLLGLSSTQIFVFPEDVSKLKEF